MSTEAVARHVRNTITQRLALVDLIVTEADHDAFVLHGTDKEGITDSGAILAPGGKATWTTAQLLDLLATIREFGRSSAYNLTMRRDGSIAQFNIMFDVHAGEIPILAAGTVAARYGADIRELMEVRNG
jgi:hypothetical protein